MDSSLNQHTFKAMPMAELMHLLEPDVYPMPASRSAKRRGSSPQPNTTKKMKVFTCAELKYHLSMLDRSKQCLKPKAATPVNKPRWNSSPKIEYKRNGSIADEQGKSKPAKRMLSFLPRPIPRNSMQNINSGKTNTGKTNTEAPKIPRHTAPPKIVISKDTKKEDVGSLCNMLGSDFKEPKKFNPCLQELMTCKTKVEKDIENVNKCNMSGSNVKKPKKSNPCLQELMTCKTKVEKDIENVNKKISFWIKVTENVNKKIATFTKLKDGYVKLFNDVNKLIEEGQKDNDTPQSELNEIENEIRENSPTFKHPIVKSSTFKVHKKKSGLKRQLALKLFKNVFKKKTREERKSSQNVYENKGTH